MILLFVCLSIVSVVKYLNSLNGTDFKVSIRMANSKISMPTSAEQVLMSTAENGTSANNIISIPYRAPTALILDSTYDSTGRHFCQESDDPEVMHANYLAVSIIAGILSILSYDFFFRAQSNDPDNSSVYLGTNRLLQNQDFSIHAVLRLRDMNILMILQEPYDEGRSNCNAHLDNLIDQSTLELEELKDDHASRRQDILRDFNQQQADQVAATESLLHVLPRRQQEQLSQLQVYHNAQTSELSNEYKNRLEAIKAQYKQQVNRIADTESSAMDKVAAEYQSIADEAAKDDMLDTNHTAQAKAVLDFVIQRHLEVVERSIGGLLALQKNKVEEDSEAALSNLEVQYRADIEKLSAKHAFEFNKALEDQRVQRDEMEDNNQRQQEELVVKRDARLEKLDTEHHRLLDDRNRLLKEKMLQILVDQLRQDIDRLQRECREQSVKGALSRREAVQELETTELFRKDFLDYKQLKEAEIERLSTRLQEAETMLDSLEQEKLDLLIAAKDNENALSRLESEREQLSKSKILMATDLSGQISELTRDRQALSEELSLSKSSLEEVTRDRDKLAQDMSVAMEQELQKVAHLVAQCNDLRSEVADLNNSLSKAKVKIVELLKAQPSPSAPSMQ